MRAELRSLLYDMTPFISNMLPTDVVGDEALMPVMSLCWSQVPYNSEMR